MMRYGIGPPTRGRVVTAVLTVIAVICATAPAAQSAPTAQPALREPAAKPKISASELPLLKSTPVPQHVPSLGQPVPRPEQDSGQRSKPTAIAEVVEQETAKTRVFRNDDGSLTIDESATPVNHKGKDGAWVPIDNTLRPVTRPGWVATSGNDWTVGFGPLSQGLELSTTAGTVSVIPAFPNGTASGATAPAVVSPQGEVGPFTAQDRLTRRAVPAPSNVTYKAAQPGVDLRYEVRATGVKEEIVLANRAAGSQFAFDVTGAELALREDGGIALGGKIGDLFSIPAPAVFRADGSDVTEESGARYAIDRAARGASATRLTVSIDPEWLAQQDGASFPLVIDPTWNDTVSAIVSFSNPNVGPYTGSGIRVGKDSSGVVWRAALHFPGYENYLHTNYRVYRAEIDSNSPASQHLSGTTLRAYDQSSQPTSWSQVGGTEVASQFALADNNATNSFTVGATLDNWVAQNKASHWFGIRGDEGTGTLRQFENVHLIYSIYLPPQPSVVTNLTAGQIVSTTTPIFEAQAVADNDDGRCASYRFQITTGATPNSGVVWSGRYPDGIIQITVPCGSLELRQATVPAGVLLDGTTYYAWAFTSYDTSYDPAATYAETSPITGRQFTVRLGLGEGGSSPTDKVGSVPGSAAASPAEGAPSPSLPSSALNVNMVNGNLSASMGTKTLGTLSGGLSLGFTYNSILTGTTQGLQAEYFNDTNSNNQIDEGIDQLVAKRTDPNVALSPSGRLPTTPFTAPSSQDPTKALDRWTGTVSLPAGTWQLDASSTGGVRISSGSTVLLDQWATHSLEDDLSSSFTATANKPIEIDWHHGTGSDQIVVWAKSSDGHVYDLSQYVTRPTGAMPVGWTLNGAAASARWVGLQDRGTFVSMIASDGSSYEFVASGNGAYTSPIEAPTDLLSVGDSGRFVLQTADGQTYTFRSDGQLESLVTAGDDLNPAALQYGYSGSPLRLRTITDPVSNRAANLYYGGDTPCGSVEIAVTGYLCQVAYWDGSATTLTYDSAGLLIRFTHPGDIVYDLGYTAGLLSSIRDPLAAAAVAAGVRADDATVLTAITYDANGRVSTVTQPAPAAGAARPQRIYTYSTNQTAVAVAGFTPPSGFAQRVTYDSRNRLTARTDAAGLTTTYAWDTSDRQVANTDPASLKTTTHYDNHGRPTQKYGPAPASSFDVNGYPISGATVPLTTTEYDGTITGLAATYWTNPNVAGPPGRHGTGLGTGGDMYKDWNTTLPVTPGTGGWSARFSGDVNTVADSYTWQIQTRGSLARVWIDGAPVVSDTQPEPATGWTIATGTAAALSAGTHNIRVDMVDTSGPAGLQVLWSRSGAPTLVTLPGSVLGPNYGLVTSVTDPDTKVTRTEYSDVATGIGPEYQLPTATVQDPGISPHLNLRTVTTYEAPGTGSFLRRIAKTLPAAAGNPCAPGSYPCTIFTNYGGTEGAPGPYSGGSIGIRASTSAGNTVTSTLTLNTPAGAAAGDVLVAGVATRGGSDVTVVPPAGWILIRTDNNSNSLQLSSYWHVAGSSEPATYTWNLTASADGTPTSKAAAGTISAYSGVDSVTPLDATGGQVDPNSTLSIVAPSITTTAANDRVVGLFTIANASNIDPPSGSSAMTEIAEANSNVSGQAHVDIETADTTQATAGAAGTKTATGSGTAARTNGQLIALRPSNTGACGVPAATPQGGKPKRVTNPDPDGAGPQVARAEDFVYDTIGRQVGHRTGTTATIDTAPWSCTSYDPQGRVLTQSWAAAATAPARTVTYLYGVGGNPLVNAVSDTAWGSAAVAATVDLLDRVVSYSDIYSGTTTTQYNQAGRVINVTGPAGNHTQNYTPEGRPGTVIVDDTTMATPNYDSVTGRLSSVTYANGTTTTLGYDPFGRANATSTVNGSSTTINGDQVTYSTGSRVSDDQVYTGSSYVDANSGGDNYLYDATGRLTTAQLPGTTYAYDYGTSSGCTAPDAGKNTNRSTLTVTGTGAGTTSYCYDQADRLVSSTDHASGTVVYDDHGNNTQLGSEILDFDASDRHVRTEVPTTVTRYWRDPLDRIVDRVDMTRTSYVASTTATATANSVSVARPTGTQAGDLIIAGVTMANPGTLSASGWTVAATQPQGTQGTWILWRYATSGDPASWTISATGATQVTAALASYRGPTALAPIAVTGSAATSAGTSHPLPQVTTTSDANHLVHVVGFGGNVTPTAPTGSQRAVQAGAVSLLLADHYQSEPGQNPAANATTTTAVNSASLTVAIVPASTDRHLGYADHSDNASHLDDSSGALIERYYSLPGGVNVTETGPAQQQSVFSDDFTGTTGANWNSSKWAATSNDSTKKVDIQSNQGELYVNGSSARATATMTAIANAEATFSYRFSDRNSASYLRIYLRASGATGSNQMPNAYRLEIASDSSTITLQKFVNSAVTQIRSFGYTKDTNTQRVRFRVQGSTIEGKVWPDGTPEPGNWSVVATDTAITGTGVLQIAHSQTSGSRSVYLDDLAVTVPATPARTWSYANIHGDVTATADNNGTRTWIGWYGPYGENPAGLTPGNTAAGGTNWGWKGQQQRLSDRDLIHMGARPYVPSLGRFLAVDPVEGGCANDYAYVHGDPINQADLNGKYDFFQGLRGFSLGSLFRSAAENPCQMLLGASIVLGVAAVGYGGAVLTIGTIASGIAAPLTAGNKKGAADATYAAVATLVLFGLGRGLLTISVGKELFVADILLQATGGAWTVKDVYQGVSSSGSTC
ncbi:MAG: hypothetical protein QOI86_4225 [Actinomycetota bacterium]|jgi:RHS repeat-associated protein|nr:hypothetical protein [Actinomycetota bacterium]